VLTYAEADVKKSTTGYPTRTFLLPVRTSTLVGIPMLIGVIVAPAVYVVWAVVVYRPIGVALSLWWPALLLATGMVSFQTIVWGLGAYPVVRLVAFVSVATGLGYLGIAAAGVYETNFPVRPAMAVGLPLLMVIAHRMAIVGVGLHRCGEWPRVRRERAVWRPRAARSFDSP